MKVFWRIVSLAGLLGLTACAKVEEQLKPVPLVKFTIRSMRQMKTALLQHLTSPKVKPCGSTNCRKVLAVQWVQGKISCWWVRSKAR